MSTYATNRSGGGGGGGSGTVTSVGLSDNSTTPIYTVGGSPVTSTGTLTLTLDSQSANTVFAGPASGGSSEPTFRDLVSSDIPNLSAIYVTQSEVGVANGVASLDSGGKVPVSQLPATVMEYQGNWNPNTNSPALSDGTGTNGNIYWVSAVRASAVSGLNNASMVNFQVGDLVLYSSVLGQWQLTTPAAGVSSVNGSQGAVTVNAINQLTGDVTAGPASGSQSVSASLVATTNSTLVTLSSLSLPTSQITGTFPTSRLSGDIDLTTQVSGILPISNGGTNAASANAAFDNLSPMTTAGDMIYENSTPTAARLPIGSSGQILTVSGGIPSWQTPSSVTYLPPTVQILSINTWSILPSGTVTVVFGAVYEDSNGNFFISQNSGTGLTQFYLIDQGPSTNIPTGTLTKQSGGGDASITVVNATVHNSTYTTPTSPSPLYIEIEMVGGGGGGGASGASPVAGSSGSDSIFGTSLLVANGGGGSFGGGGGSGGIGGSYSISSPGIQLIALSGGTGADSENSTATTNLFIIGGSGGSNPFGGSGQGSVNTAGYSASPNTGGGGGGAGTPSTGVQTAGSGGGAGGYVEAQLNSPSSTYTYQVGVGGAGGPPGAYAGGKGAQGIIIVREYYQ